MFEYLCDQHHKKLLENDLTRHSRAYMVQLFGQVPPNKGKKMSVKMPKIVQVACDICGYVDTANWSDVGSEQPCLGCDAAPVYLSRI